MVYYQVGNVELDVSWRSHMRNRMYLPILVLLLDQLISIRARSRLTSGGSIVPPMPIMSLQLDSMYRTHRPDKTSVIGMMYSDRLSVSVPPFIRSIPAPPVKPTDQPLHMVCTENDIPC